MELAEESELEMLMVTYKDSCKICFFPLHGEFFKSTVKFYGFKLFRIHSNSPQNKRTLNALHSWQIILLFLLKGNSETVGSLL